MKKILLLTLVTIAATSSLVFAQNMGEYHAAHGYHSSNAGYCGQGNGGCGQGAGYNGGCYGATNNAEVTVNNKEDAQKLVKEQITSLRGYKIISSEEYQGNGHKGAYKVFVQDTAGNDFFYFVSPYGRVFGPNPVVR